MQASNWRQSLEIRDYLAALARYVSDGRMPNISPEHFKSWLKWAHEQADRLDPLSPTPPSILDELLPKIPEVPSYW